MMGIKTQAVEMRKVCKVLLAMNLCSPFGVQFLEERCFHLTQTTFRFELLRRCKNLKSSEISRLCLQKAITDNTYLGKCYCVHFF